MRVQLPECKNGILNGLYLHSYDIFRNSKVYIHPCSFNIWALAMLTYYLFYQLTDMSIPFYNISTFLSEIFVYKWPTKKQPITRFQG